MSDLPDTVVIGVAVGTLRVSLPVEALVDPKQAVIKARRREALKLVGAEYDAKVREAKAEWKKLRRSSCSICGSTNGAHPTYCSNQNPLVK